MTHKDGRLRTISAIVVTMLFLPSFTLARGSFGLSGSAEIFPKIADLTEEIGQFYSPLFERALDIQHSIGIRTGDVVYSIGSGMYKVANSLIGSEEEVIAMTGKAWDRWSAPGRLVADAFTRSIDRTGEVWGEIAYTVVNPNDKPQLNPVFDKDRVAKSDDSPGINILAGIGSIWDSFVDQVSNPLVPLFVHDANVISPNFDGGKFKIHGDICVDDLCVTKEQFKQMLVNSGGVQSVSGGSVSTENVSRTSGESAVGNETPVAGSDDEALGATPTQPEMLVEPSLEPSLPTDAVGSTPEPAPVSEPVPTE